MSEKKQVFGGATKKGESILGPWERRFVQKHVDKVPRWLETYHLTYMTILWCIFIVLSGWLANKTGNMHWLWISSVSIVLQYITDLFDGAVGRHRNTGLIKWGYYMDHFLDFVFLCAILISYAFFVTPGQYLYLFFILAILCGYMVNSFLSAYATNEFQIAYYGFGPTEVRIMFIGINTLFIIFGTAYLNWTLPACLIIAAAGLIFMVYKTQKHLWAVDMKVKAEAEAESANE